MTTGANAVPKPNLKPHRPQFSSGPTVKRPGWSAAALAEACLGRSHRSKQGKAKLTEALDLSRAILGLPVDYRIGIVPGSDTGAVEMALWSLLGARGVDVLAWEAFGKGWVSDIAQQLKLADLRKLEAPYGRLPDLGAVDFDRDVVFAWNGTTSGVRVPDGEWIPEAHDGLVICDATSAVFAMDLPWAKLDVVTWSWQKVLGGEGAHGLIVLSPRAVARLESHQPAWPLPKIFQLASKGKLNEGIFRGETINTPSLLVVEDAIDALRWAQAIGGLPALIARTEANAAVIARWVEASPWAGFLAETPATRSPTSICLRITDPGFLARDAAGQAAFAKSIADRLEAEEAAFDIGAYRDAPPGLRIWGGATVESADIEALLPWLDWAFAETRSA
ncbi:MAG TPA: phosphoserine transaminase [Verrucomicrobiae bacterium]|nr:phosphoserine transaminase [Verrucomicrobiae bacterium]